MNNTTPNAFDILTNRNVLFALALLVAIPLVIFGLNGFYVRHIADDFCIANDVQVYGFWGHVWHNYQTWSGRIVPYLLTGIDTHLPHILEFTFFVGMFILWWLSLYGIIFELLSIDMPNRRSLAAILSSLLCSASLNTLPMLVQSVYWINGRMVYTASLMFICVHGWLVTQKKWQGRYVDVLTGVLAFISALSVINYSITHIALLFLLLLVWRRSERRSRVVASLIGASVGFLILYSSPGNAIRRSMFPNGDIMSSIRFAFDFSDIPVREAFEKSPVIVITLFATTFLYGWFFEKRTIKGFWPYLIALPVVSAGVILGNFALGAYAQGGALAYRARVLPFFIVICGMAMWFYLLAGIGNWVAEWIIQYLSSTERFVSAATWFKRFFEQLFPRILIVSVIVLLGSAVFVSTRYALTTGRDLRTYARNWDERDALLRAADPSETAIVPYFVGEGWDVGEVQYDPTSGWMFVNNCIAEYYGLAGVMAAPPDDIE